MAKKKSLAKPLHIGRPGETHPPLVTGYLTRRGLGEWAFASTRDRTVWIHIHDDHQMIRNTAKGGAPLARLNVVKLQANASERAAKVVKEIRKEGGESPAAGTVLRGRWVGRIELQDGAEVPTITLRRKLAPYATVLVWSEGSAWRWSVEAAERWYSSAEVTQPQSAPTLYEAIDAAVAGALDIVSARCSVRDTSRRQARDPEYARSRPIAPIREARDGTRGMTAAPARMVARAASLSAELGTTVVAGKRGAKWGYLVSSGGQNVWAPDVRKARAAARTAASGKKTRASKSGRKKPTTRTWTDRELSTFDVMPRSRGESWQDDVTRLASEARTSVREGRRNKAKKVLEHAVRAFAKVRADRRDAAARRIVHARLTVCGGNTYPLERSPCASHTHMLHVGEDVGDNAVADIVVKHAGANHAVGLCIGYVERRTSDSRFFQSYLTSADERLLRALRDRFAGATGPAPLALPDNVSVKAANAAARAREATAPTVDDLVKRHLWSRGAAMEVLSGMTGSRDIWKALKEKLADATTFREQMAIDWHESIAPGRTTQLDALREIWFTAPPQLESARRHIGCAEHAMRAREACRHPESAVVRVQVNRAKETVIYAGDAIRRAMAFSHEAGFESYCEYREAEQLVARANAFARQTMQAAQACRAGQQDLFVAKKPTATKRTATKKRTASKQASADQAASTGNTTGLRSLDTIAAHEAVAEVVREGGQLEVRLRPGWHFEDGVRSLFTHEGHTAKELLALWRETPPSRHITGASADADADKDAAIMSAFSDAVAAAVAATLGAK